MKIKRVSRSTRSRFIDKEMKPFFNESFRGDGADEIIKAFSKPERAVFLGAMENGELVGVISLHYGHKVARIGAFVVAKDARSRGIGTSLLEACQALARKKGCVKAWLFTLPQIPAYRFYKAHGFFEEARLRKHFGGKDLCILSRFL